MKRRLITACTAAVLLTVGLSMSPASAATPEPATPESAPAAAFDPAPAAAAISRLLPAQAAQFTLTPVARPSGGDYFTISGRPGAITVEGTSPATILTGVGWYLNHVAKVDIGLPGDSTSRLPATLPAPPDKIVQSATVSHRFAFNDTNDGYAGAYRDWPTIQRQLDVLALHGINEVFVQTGEDAVYYQTMRDFGYTPAELRSWIPGPEHQSWWLLQNMSGFGGPVSDQLLTARAALGRQIVDRLHELGMTPVLPGYFGTVPPNFVAKNPGAKVVPQGDWVGFARPDWLDPTNALYPRVANSFYQHQKALIGTSSMYKMDLLHEGGKAGDVPIGGAAQAVFTAMDNASPGAIWVLLGWQRNPRTEIIDAVDHRRLFIVDGLSDRYDNLDRETTWRGTPYAFGTIPNFGGHTTIGANTGVWATRFAQWRSKPNSALSGIAYLPEAAGTDPATFEVFAELAWRPGKLDQTQWFADYAESRYGAPDPHASKAWDYLRQGPYSMPSGVWSEPQDSLFTARPDLSATSAASWSPDGMRYDAGTVRHALTELLAVDPRLRDTDAYRYDLVNTARQALTNRSRVLLPELKAAYDAKDLAAFRARAKEWRDDLALLDKLLRTDQHTLFGPWLQAAKSWGATEDEQRTLEYDARSILTTWGPRVASDDNGLHDYANRELSGLVSDFYAMRWNRYLDALDAALATNSTPVAIDWFAVEDGWNNETQSYPTTPSGDPYRVATEVATTLPALT